MRSPAELFSLAGRIALVTGATRGLGWAMAQALSAAGATVAVNGRDAGRAEACAKTLGSRAFVADITDEAQAIALVERVVAEYGRLDILVNNAGSIHRGAFDRHGTQDWRRVLDINLDAAFRMARQAAGVMKSQGRGRIINIGSVFSSIARPGAASYITSKHALVGLTRAIAVEFGGRGITCNLIGPGFIATDLNAEIRKDQAFVDRIVARTPVGRWGDPTDLDGAVVFLASDASAYVNGQVLNVDGGMAGSF